jgi:hypothetical protein
MSDAYNDCPWNSCEECGENIDVDDCFDGSVVRCLACDTEHEVIECQDDSWMLVVNNPMTINADEFELELPWNACKRCEQTIGVEGCVSGSVRLCPACDAKYECVEDEEGLLILADRTCDDSES